MTAVLNDVIIALIGLCILAAVFFVFRGVRSRSLSSREAYGVGQQKARRSMQIDIARSVAFVLVGLILWGVYGLSVRPTAATFDPVTPLPTRIPLLPSATATPANPSPTATAPAQGATAELLEPTPTQTATPVPEPTEASPTPAPRTAIVISEVGVWLRSTPGTGGEQLEWVLNGTLLTLLPGLETTDEFVWQQVRTPAGNEGWVATDFIEVNE